MQSSMPVKWRSNSARSTPARSATASAVTLWYPCSSTSSTRASRNRSSFPKPAVINRSGFRLLQELLRRIMPEVGLHDDLEDVGEPERGAVDLPERDPLLEEPGEAAGDPLLQVFRQLLGERALLPPPGQQGDEAVEHFLVAPECHV